MTTEQSFVIVGGGLAGASAAEELRKQGFTGSVHLIAGERHSPYIRPPLSKGYLNGSEGSDDVYVHPHDWYAQNQIELATGTKVSDIDRSAHEVKLAGGGRLRYDKLLVATGSVPRRLSIEGSQLDGLHYLRTIDHSRELQAELKSGGRRVVVIGAGWIGMEVAATARSLGNDVTILENAAIPLVRALGEELGTMFAELHQENGVVLRASVSVSRIVGSDGRLTGVELEGGEVVPADLVVVGIGASPDVEVAQASGLDVHDGILTTASLQTSDPDVYAAGDVANAVHPVIGQRLRSEHWANALNQGAAAARAMLGQEVSFDEIPYFYTDQFDLGMEYSGYAPLTADAKVVIRGNRAGREFIAFWVTDGAVVAGMNVNVWDVNEQVQRIIRSGAKIDEARLIDEAVPLEDL